MTVLGAAGCGKTRLLEEFRAQAQAAGSVVLTARCHDGESELPFALAADLLRTALSVCPELPARLPAHAAAMTGRLCPELAADYPDDPAPLDSPMALTRLYGAIGEVLRTAASPGLAGPPAGVIVVEDAHWADGPSLDLLAYLVRRLPGWPLLLVISCSTEHTDRLRGLRAALSEAADAGQGTVVEPAPLREEQIRDLLLRSGVRDADVGRLLTQTRGLPMLVREYVEGTALGSRRQRRALVAARLGPGTAAQAGAGGQRAHPADAVHRRRAGQRLRRGPAPRGQRAGRDGDRGGPRRGGPPVPPHRDAAGRGSRRAPL